MGINSSSVNQGASICRSGLLLTGLAIAIGMPVANATPLPLPNQDPPPLPGGAQPGGQIAPIFRPSTMVDPSQIVFEIPPVFERPLGIDEGGRVFVRKFLITGVVDDTQAGILKSEIDQRVEQRFEDLNTLLAQLRVKRQNQDEVGEDGFTPDERKAVVEFMADVIRDLSPDRQVEAYRSFVDQLRFQRLERDQGLTIGQLQLIADEITRYYRERGFFLARAVIPAQEVVDGIVVVRVLEGRLGQVLVEGNRRYSAERIQDPFVDAIGKLVTVDAIEDSLLTLQSYPGLNAVGVFQPGKEVGEADLLINVSNEHFFDLNLRADNHGTRFTGENRLVADITMNNPSSYGDFVQLTAMQTYTPDNSLFGGLKYQIPFSNPRHTMGLELTHNSFDVANLSGNAAGNEVGGVSDIGKLFYGWNLTRTRGEKTNLKFSVSHKTAETESGDLLVNRDRIASFNAEYNFELINAGSATIHSGFLRADVGLDGLLGVPTEEELMTPGFTPQPSRGAGTPFVASSKFSKLSFGYSWLKSMTENQTLLVRVNGQYSKDFLTSLEQFVIGGPNTVRALPSSQFLVDYGAFGSIEWGIRAPGFADKPAFANRNWGDLLRVTLFYDHAVGYYNIGEGQSNTAGLLDDISEGGVGIGIEFGLPGTFRLNVQAAQWNGEVPDDADPADPRAVLDDVQYWVDFTMEF